MKPPCGRPACIKGSSGDGWKRKYNKAPMVPKIEGQGKDYEIDEPVFLHEPLPLSNS